MCRFKISTQPKPSLLMTSNPTATQWKFADSCQTFSITYTCKKNKSRGITLFGTLVYTSPYFYSMAVPCGVILPSEA